MDNTGIINSVGLFQSHEKLSGKDRSLERTVKEYEIEYYFENGKNSYINGRVHPMREGNIIVARPGDKRYSDLHFRCFFLHADGLSPLEKEIIDSLPTIIRAKRSDEIKESFLRMSAFFLSDDKIDHLALLGEFYLLLQKIKVCTMRQSEQTYDKNIIKNAEAFIEYNFSAEITVDDVAKYCNISTPYLHKIYSEVFRSTPHAEILARRILEAKNLLINSSLTINQIAYRCGFNSQAYFSDAFKRTVGVSPNIFRRSTRHMA